MTKRLLVLVAAVALLSMAPLAHAEGVPVAPADFQGCRDTGAGGGLTAVNPWTFEICWDITDNGNGTFTYEYTITVDPSNSLSHWVLEVSSNFTTANLLDFDGPFNFESDFLKDHNENGFTIFGIKFDDVSCESPCVFTIVSDRAPMWGDFFAKDGQPRGPVYNAGIGTDPDPNGPFTNWIAVPNTENGRVPEPATLGLLGIGLVGMGVTRFSLRRP